MKSVGMFLGRALCRVIVEGPSMLPSLAPGERLLVRKTLQLRIGDVVVIRDPAVPARLLIKRVVILGPSGIEVAGDNPGVSRDSRIFGTITYDQVLGRAFYRYFPSDQRGPIPRGTRH